MQDYRFSDAVESFSEKLMIFEGPTQEVAILAHKKVRFYPEKLSDDPDAPICIDVDGTSGGYIDGANTELTVEAKIVQENGDAVTATDHVTIANQGLHTYFASLIVKLNDVEVNPNVGTLHGYKNYLETVCFGSDESKNSIGSQKGFYPDSTGTVSQTDPSVKVAPINAGLNSRFKLTKSGKTFILKGKPGVDFLEKTGRLIPNGVKIRYEFYQQRDCLRLIAKDDTKKYSLRITNMYITACIAKIRPEMLIRHAQLLAEGKKATYPFPRTVMRSFNIPAGDSSFVLNKVMSDRVPSLLIVALVESSSFAGKYNKNNYDLKHFDVTCAKFTVDQQVVPQTEFKPDYANEKCAEEYSSFLGLNRGSGNSVTKQDFLQGNTVLVFDLQHHVSMEDGSFPVICKGFTSLELTFKTALTAGVTGIMYMTVPGMYRITEARNIEVEY